MLSRTLGNLALIVYFATDHPLYLHGIGFWKLDPKFYKRLDFINNFFWLLENLFDVWATLHEMGDIKTQIKQQVSSAVVHP